MKSGRRERAGRRRERQGFCHCWLRGVELRGQMVESSGGLTCENAESRRSVGGPHWQDRRGSAASSGMTRGSRERRVTTVRPPARVFEALCVRTAESHAQCMAATDYKRFAELHLKVARARACSWSAAARTARERRPVFANYPGIELIESDVYFGPRTALVCDGVPFADASLNSVIITGRPRARAQPLKKVQEIHRVLKAEAPVYAETPFMQQVHVARYDITRFGDVGRRQKFRQFTEVRGVALGTRGRRSPGSISTLLLSFCRLRSARVFARGSARSPASGLEYAEPLRE